jgi:hypothetical protein
VNERCSFLGSRQNRIPRRELRDQQRRREGSKRALGSTSSPPRYMTLARQQTNVRGGALLCVRGSDSSLVRPSAFVAAGAASMTKLPSRLTKEGGDVIQRWRGRRLQRRR